MVMRDFPSRPVALNIGNRRIGGGEKLFMVLGPCVIESEELTLRIAAEVAALGERLDIPVIFKASFDKANRTSIESYRGPGIERGLETLSRVREATGLPVLSDIHTPDQAALAGEVLDVIQIPAFLCRQTDILMAAGKTGKAVNIKKGQFLAPDQMEHAARKVLSAGNDSILLTDRGTSFGYQDLVADMRSIVRLKRFGFPVIFDATHSVQAPGAGDACSGGDRSLTPYLARAAVAAGADGIFMEAHPDPDRALCDGPNSLSLSDLEPLAANLKALFEVVKNAQSPASTQTAARVREEPGETLEDKLRKIRLIIFDVDGILTDGRIVFGSGGLEIKFFDVRDGHGIKIAKRVGLEVAFVTGRISEIVPQRAEDLGITIVHQKVWDKKKVLAEILEQQKLSPDQILVMGDDVVDIPLFRRVGVGVTVPEAPAEVRREATYITRHSGGRGAAREVVEMTLKAQGLWDKVMARYYE